MDDNQLEELYEEYHNKYKYELKGIEQDIKKEVNLKFRGLDMEY